MVKYVKFSVTEEQHRKLYQAAEIAHLKQLGSWARKVTFEAAERLGINMPNSRELSRRENGGMPDNDDIEDGG